MNDLEFMNDFIRRTKPKVPLRYALNDEGRILMEMDRVEELASTAHERKREEIETNKLIGALLKEKHDAFVTKQRRKQLLLNTDELRKLRYYISTAETAKDLIAQLKLEEVKIENRFEEANQFAIDLRARYRAEEERLKRLEYEKCLEKQRFRNDLIAQMKANSLRRADEVEEFNRYGRQIKEKLDKLDEEDRIKEEAAAKFKLELRKEILETLHEREELFKSQNQKDMTTVQAQYSEQDRLAAQQQRIKDLRHLGIQHKAQISAMIGEKVYKIEKAKRDAVTTLIDVFINERKVKDDLECQKKMEQAYETRQMYYKEVLLHLERKEGEEKRRNEANMEAALKRKPLKNEEQDRPKGKLRNVKKMLEAQQFTAEKLAMDKERFMQEAEERRQLLENFEKEAELRENEIEAAKNEILHKKPIELLRYFPSSVLCTDYIPEPLRSKVHEEVRKEPIPMLTRKRHLPHLRGHHHDPPRQVKCSTTCTNPHIMSNVFPMY